MRAFLSFRRKWGRLLLGWAALATAGCPSISIAPTCPAELEVGASSQIAANPMTPGATPRYEWNVLPPDAGTIEDPAAPITRFTATKAGEVTLQLTAADGLFQAVSQCRTLVVAPGDGDVAVALTANPNPAEVGQTVTLTCTTEGAIAAVTRSLSQTGGPNVELVPESQGVATFVPEQTGDHTFQCVGRSDDDTASQPASVTVTVSSSNGPSRPPRR